MGGHVLPKSQKPIVFSFCPQDRLSAKDVVVATSVSSIAYLGEAEAWDDSMRTVEYGTSPATSPKHGDADDTGGDSTQGEGTVKPEPEHQILDGTTKELVLKLSAAADQRTYTCSTEKIHFAPTVMFQ